MNRLQTQEVAGKAKATDSQWLLYRVNLMEQESNQLVSDLGKFEVTFKTWTRSRPAWLYLLLWLISMGRLTRFWSA